MKTLDEQALEDIMVGCAYLGTGGGGSLDIARSNLKAALDDGCEFRLMSVEEMGDDDYAASPYDVGSLSVPDGPPPEGTHGEYNTRTVEAFRGLVDYVGKRFTAVAIGEIGPESTANALVVAARLGLCALDADGIGRAAPEITQYSVLLAGLSTLPAVGVSPRGDKVIIDSLSDQGLEEEVFRTIAAKTGYASVADAPMPGSVAKRPGVLVTGSISLCLRIGQAFRQASSGDADPVDAVLQAVDGYRIFDGVVKHADSKDSDGFTVGTVEIDGSDHDQGRGCRIHFQNENLYVEVDGSILVTVPDLVTVVDRSTSMPIGNPNYQTGQQVVVVGFRCDPIWRTTGGLERFGPRHFGIDCDYEPIEQRLSGSGRQA